MPAKVCPVCGNHEVLDGQNFCEQFGTSFEDWEAKKRADDEKRQR
jgi:uncharacterized membrane protein YvbJ